VGADALDDLVAAMLDYDAYPVFLWGSQPEPVAARAAAVAEALRSRLDGLAESGLPALQDPRLAMVLDADPPKRLLQLATQPRFNAIPLTLLHPPLGTSRVLTSIPSLADHIDNRGLLELVDEIEPQPDVVFVRDWAVPYHQFLRRGFGSRVNDALVGELLKLRDAGATVRLAIDERRMHPRRAYRRYVERDYWSGPAITEETLDDPSRRGVEIRQHGWPVGRARLPWSTEEHASVRTYLSGRIRTIEIEEITAPSLLRESTVQLVRYLHAQRDIERHVFFHVDGAVRAYDRAAYEARRGVRWPSSAANEPMNRRKVFRVDGEISTADWVETVAQWFRGSELVGEALAGLSQPSPDPPVDTPSGDETHSPRPDQT
jgi:hypothetical protein